jgi:hypothetical protein
MHPVMRNINLIFVCSTKYNIKFFYCDTVASVVIQAIGRGKNEEALMKATHPMIRLGQFGAYTKLV